MSHRIFIILLLSLGCLAVHGTDVPPVLVVGDDRGQAFPEKLTRLLEGKMIPYPLKMEFTARYISVDDVAGAVLKLKEIKKGEFRILLVCCTSGQEDAKNCSKLIARARKLGMEILWYGSLDGPAANLMKSERVCMADYAGFVRGMKSDSDAARADYIADAAAQWWTGIARSNRGIRRIPLWENVTPGYEYNGPECINAVARIDRVSEPELEFFLPAQQGASTAVVFFPGGGYSFTGFLRNARELAEALNPQGITVIGLKYRTKRKPDVTLLDARRALCMVRYHAVEWGIDPNRIGIAGQSAGAHLALNLATHFDTGDPASADPVERVSCRPDFAAPVTSWNFGSNELPFVFGQDTPPFFVRQARNDSGFRLAERLVEALKQAGVELDYRFVESGGHGAFEIMEGNPWNGWTQEFSDWLRKIGVRD